MMQIKQWILYSSLLILLIISTLFSLMIWSDTYSNTHYKRIKFYAEPNKNVLKVHYILQNKTKYDSFIFGSSRVGNINPLKISNGKYYNMTYSEGIPKEHLLNIKLFLTQGIKIKNLLIGLDEFSYQVSFKKHQHQALTKAYYKATNTSLISYYRELYLRFPLGEDRHHISRKFKQKNNFFIMDISKQTNNYENSMRDFNKTKFTLDEHINNKSFNKPTYYNGNTLKSTLIEIQEIQNICTNHSINCYFFINPIYHKTYEYTNQKLLKNFKEELSEITSFYDFSIQSPLSYNNSYWQETSHYTLEVGDMILNTIYNKKSLLNKNSIPFIFIKQKENNAL